MVKTHYHPDIRTSKNLKKNSKNIGTPPFVFNGTTLNGNKNRNFLKQTEYGKDIKNSKSIQDLTNLGQPDIDLHD